MARTNVRRRAMARGRIFADGGIALDSAAFRAHFPGLRDYVHLCSCSQGALSDRVEEAMGRYLQSWRSRGAPWDVWMGELERARALFAARIGAHADEIAALSCATEGAYQAVSAVSYDRRAGIVACDLEFPSIAHIWLAQEARGAHVTLVSDLDPDRLAERFLDAVGPDTALVSIPMAAYGNGARLPVRELTAECARRGARVFVDAYQAAGVWPIDAHALGCDYLVAGTLKYLLGSPGLAFLYVRSDRVAEHRPQLTGWFGRKNPFAFDPGTLDYAKSARRLELGTPAVPAAWAAVAGLELLAETDPDAVRGHVVALADRLQTALVAGGVPLASPTDPAHRGPQVAVSSDDAEALAAFLTDHGVVGAPRGAAVRLSLHYYNTAQEMDRAAALVIEHTQGATTRR